MFGFMTYSNGPWNDQMGWREVYTCRESEAQTRQTIQTRQTRRSPGAGKFSGRSSEAFWRLHFTKLTTKSIIRIKLYSTCAAIGGEVVRGGEGMPNLRQDRKKNLPTRTYRSSWIIDLSSRQKWTAEWTHQTLHLVKNGQGMWLRGGEKVPACSEIYRRSFRSADSYFRERTIWAHNTNIFTGA